MANTTGRAAYLTDYWTLRDDLQFSDFRPALRNILTGAQTPLTVGVFGPWGSGKTSLLRMLKDDIDNQGLRFVRTVWFTAWKYDRHEALWRAFILRVLDALYPRVPGEGAWEKRERIPVDELDDEQKAQVAHLDRLSRSLDGAVEWEELGRWVMEWQKAGKELSKLPAFLLLLSVGAEKVADMLGIAPDMAELVRQEAQSHRLEQLASMEQFEGTFREALQSILGEEGRLVVFVDDLDRCLPEKAVEVLEAIKLFLEVPGTAFVLGMDREVIERGIEARYSACFRREGTEGEERAELPIRGDVYLQKIVQIPFHLPPLAVEDLEGYILALEKGVSSDARLSKMTRAVFAHGLFPNPRQVKRALNILRLLREIARAREDRGGLPKGGVAWPLLAKTVLIQTQWPRLYRDWRQYPTLVQTLEAEYARRPSTEEEALRGRVALPPETPDGEGEAPEGDLLGPYLRDRRRYALLERMLAFPEPGEAGEGRKRARFKGLGRPEVAAYVRLAGAVGPEEPAIEVPGDLLAEILSGDRARAQDAAARLEEQESERDGPFHQTIREQLLQVMRNPGRAARERVSAGDSLALVGDPRFRPHAWYLPDEPLLGFVEVSEGPFLMGTREEDVPALLEQFAGEQKRYEWEIPQHELTLPTCYVARYLVTVAQFRAFVEASGHEPADEGSLHGLANHPVVRVTWHDALAYCRWLTRQLQEWDGTPEPLAGLLRGEGWVLTLPSEAEWEKAARGGMQIPNLKSQTPMLVENPEPGRVFPWGNGPDAGRANYGETGLGTTSAVGCFPGGAGPYGVGDLSGNVWEWTRSLWGKDRSRPDFGYPYDAGDGREDLEAGESILRVLRGGAFSYDERGVRCAFRRRDFPDYRGRSEGFRLVASPVPL